MNQQQQRNVSNPLTAMAHVAHVCVVPFPTDPDLSVEEMRVRLNAWYDRQCEVVERALGDGWIARRPWVEKLLRREAELRLAEMGWRLK